MELDQDEKDSLRLMSFWNFSSDTAHRLLLRELGYPYEAKTPVDFAKSALVNLNDLELQEVLDWLTSSPP